MSELTYLKDVSSLTLDPSACIGCGVCMVVCPHAVFSTVNGKAAIADRDACMECGACAMNCPVNAIEVESGVGCAAGILKGILRGTGPSCDCSGGKSGCC
jgi:NAD-dependent dihydropyrimidine dehydrogenase PreA subunit